MIYDLAERSPRIADDAYIAPSATIIGDVHIGAAASVWFGAVLRGDVERITIGSGSNVQDNSVLHSDPGAPLVLGDRVTVGHMVTLHGCHVGDEALIGIGAVVLNHARIGARSVVGAGALVTEGKEFPDGVLILGSPARLARPLTAEELARFHSAADRYVDRRLLYASSLRPRQ
ncbi:MAG: gamma carbonic anhydrase family protein [Gammaproteobacteria bacterium]|jgi:carbonic anhydrase/acetyltransferase-like protein (isoleucine patch superfamily)|nr:gamma carbonic anhydrase family protein [Gammaproteobacteria bacterium]